MNQPRQIHLEDQLDLGEEQDVIREKREEMRELYRLRAGRIKKHQFIDDDLLGKLGKNGKIIQKLNKKRNQAAARSVA